MELLEFTEEEKNVAIDIVVDDDDDDDNTDLFCEEDVDEDYVSCPDCGENNFAHFFEPCRRMIYTNCVKNNNCQLSGLYKLTLSRANRGHWEWVCYLRRSKWWSRGADWGGINRASERRGRRQQTN